MLLGAKDSECLDHLSVPHNILNICISLNVCWIVKIGISQELVKNDLAKQPFAVSILSDLCA